VKYHLPKPKNVAESQKNERARGDLYLKRVRVDEVKR